jgi:ATP-dependent Clp protease ATP-binding subunit ClpC
MAVSFELFTAPAQRAVTLGREEARELGSAEVEPRHILLGLLHEQDGAAARALEASGLLLTRARGHAGATTGSAPADAAPPFSAATKQMLAGALREASRRGDGRLGAEHLLLAVVAAPDGALMLAELGVDADALRAEVAWILSLRPEVPPTPEQVPQLLVELDEAIEQLVARNELAAAGELRTKQRRIGKLLREIREDLRALEPDGEP